MSVVSSNNFPGIAGQNRLSQASRISEQRWPESAVPLVSICCCTYNHEKYIAQCIEGFLMQETVFPVEILIHDDASTDRTTEIVRSYQAKYPRLIRTIIQKENRRSQGKTIISVVYDACRAEYAAICDGDDFWIEPRKLARQVALFEDHPECVSCFHNVRVVSDDPEVPVKGYHPHEDGSKLMCPPNMADRFSQEEFLERNVMPTCSVMFRRTSIGALPPWFYTLPFGDHALHILCTEHGPAAYLPQIMGAYRLHNTSVWSASSEGSRLERTIQMYEVLEKHYAGKPQRVALRRCRLNLLWAQVRLLRRLAKHNESSTVANAYLNLASVDPIYCVTNFTRFLRMLFFKYGKSQRFDSGL